MLETAGGDRELIRDALCRREREIAFKEEILNDRYGQNRCLRVSRCNPRALRAPPARTLDYPIGICIGIMF